MLAVKQHHRPERPCEQFAEGCKNTSKRRIIEGERLILGVNDAQQDKSDRKNAGGIAENKQRALKPATLIHCRAKVHQGNDDDENTEQEQHCQRHCILNDDAKIDGCDTEEHKVVRAGSGDTVRNVVINVVIYMGLFENVEEQQPDEEGIQIRGTIKVKLIIEELIEQSPRPSCNHKNCKVPSERIKHDRRSSCLTKFRALFLGNKAGLQFAGKIAKIADVFGPALFGAEFNEEHAAEHSGKDADRGTCLTDIQRVSEAEICKAAADAAAVP